MNVLPFLDKEMARPTELLTPFDPQRSWDADSTPPALAAFSRKIGQLFPGIGARTPEIEAAIVLASLMHDVAYYYGGSRSEKDDADSLFRQQIPFFASLLNKEAGPVARVTAFVDEMAVTIGGGHPFQEDYSWSYGFEKAKRGYTRIDQTEALKIRCCAQGVFRHVVREISDRKFVLSDVLRKKLAAAEPDYREKLMAAVVRLAEELANRDFKGVPGLQCEEEAG
ncbi:hypothetical protein [Accumulibacter sp.]|uniref:hypothetical protein n=1 Tax=Accumulibacter sp. TaxID=2053492 RepID=UPI001AD20805|nr:hypothetical protein [Accumulibacter sp.]MBN8451685.1 hypothetical protein [Accumulibacter sp.]MBO3707660.1 hypothetical protein [Candidatus Accumulibacter conexus]